MRFLLAHVVYGVVLRANIVQAEPASGSVCGGTKVTLRAITPTFSDKVEDNRIEIMGFSAVEVLAAEAHHLLVVTPPARSAQRVQLRVWVRRVQLPLVAYFVYSDGATPYVDSWTPAHGVGGDLLTLNTRNVHNTAVVMVGNKECAARVQNRLYIQCDLPPFPSSHQPLRVFVDSQGYACFGASATDVTATDVTTADAADAKDGGGGNGVKMVGKRKEMREDGERDQGPSFQFDLRLQSVKPVDFGPRQGSLAGGRWLRVVGQGFSRDDTVRICGKDVDRMTDEGSLMDEPSEIHEGVKSFQSFRFQVPAFNMTGVLRGNATFAQCDVVIRTLAKVETSQSKVWTYQACLTPHVHSVHIVVFPAGSCNRPNSVKIIGTGFEPNTEVTMNDQPCPLLTPATNTTLRCNPLASLQSSSAGAEVRVFVPRVGFAVGRMKVAGVKKRGHGEK
eukprot:GEMP01029292.1.p1 GENE.GEMP01029292.1~~GEMP01029292.1.p1  ORF type:complete len:448 (+),score=116.51 GEMP01029292.1:127-1470(+)